MQLRAWRRAKDITQQEMANRLNVHVGTYQNWEKEPSKISIERAKQISEILGVSINDISFTEDT